MKQTNASCLLILAFSSFPISCGGQSAESVPVPPSEDPSVDSGPENSVIDEGDIAEADDSSDNASEVPVDSEPKGLCEFGSGETHIRFAAKFYEGSWCDEDHIRTTVIDDAGYRFLAVDAECRYWVKVRSYGDTRTGVLTAGQVEALYKDFRLADWSEYVGEYVAGICDNWVDWVYQYGGDIVSIGSYGMCGGTSNDQSVQWILQVNLPTYELHSAGTPLDGPVRYKLVKVFPGSAGDEDQFRNAPLWPLSTSVAKLAGEMDSKSRVAEDSDAAALRVIADSYRKGEIGESCRKFAPVVDENGVYYKL
ncbi:MAG: hypothetical protein FWD57_16175, partial [Polyangiaceae bacterium]|nr:hypothetical protein [Polyangiaceae bacterium]